MSFVIPEDIATMSAEDLDKALDDAAKEFAPLGKLSNEDITDEQVERMSALAQFVTSAKEKKAADAQAFAERNAKIDEMRANFITEEEKEKGEEETPEGEAPTEEVPAEEPAPEAPAEEVIPVVEEVIAPVEEVIPEVEAPADLPLDEDANEDEEEKEKDAVTASGKSSIANTAKNSKQEKPEAAPSIFSLTAAADIPQVSAGTKYGSLSEAAAAVSARVNSMPKGGRNGERYGALVFSRDNSNMLSQDNTRDDLELLLSAGKESRLEGGSLVAAGGWAAPSDVLLDFCDIESAEGLIEMPEVSMTRGGFQYTKGPNFETVLASSTGFWDMTEAVAEAGTELKTSLRPAIPSFVEKRMDAVGVMVEAGLLTRAGWPELVERYAKLALLAHEVKMHLKKIKGITDYTGAAVNVTNGFGNALDVLHVIDVVAAGERQRYSLGQNETLEALIPVWVRNVIRADLAQRTGVDFLSITDAQIDGFFSARKIRVQWLQHWQKLDTASGFATKYPESLEIIMYPAGTYVAGTTDVLSLDTVYDSVNLKKNDYVHLFVEQGLAVTNPCNDGRRFTIDFKATGTTAAANTTNALFRAPVTP